MGGKRDGEESPLYKYLMHLLSSMIQMVAQTCCHSNRKRMAFQLIVALERRNPSVSLGKPLGFMLDVIIMKV